MERDQIGHEVLHKFADRLVSRLNFRRLLHFWNRCSLNLAFRGSLAGRCLSDLWLFLHLPVLWGWVHALVVDPLWNEQLHLGGRSASLRVLINEVQVEVGVAAVNFAELLLQDFQALRLLLVLLLLADFATVDDLRLFIVITLELLLNQDDSMDRGINLRVMLGRAPPKLFEIGGGAWEILQPDRKLILL